MKYDSLVAKDRRSLNSLFSNHEQCHSLDFCDQFLILHKLLDLKKNEILHLNYQYEKWLDNEQMYSVQNALPI